MTGVHTHVGKQVFRDKVHICDAVSVEIAEQLCDRLNVPRIGDGHADAALAIGEHAFRAGWQACCSALFSSDTSTTQTVERAWGEYDPPEDIKALA